MSGATADVTGLYEHAAEVLGDVAPVLTARTFLGNTAAAWLVAGLVAAGMFLVLLVVRGVLVARARKAAERKFSPVWELLRQIAVRTSITLVLAISVRVGVLGLELSGIAQEGAEALVVLLVGVQAVIWATAAVDWGLVWFMRRRAGEGVDVGERQVKASMAAVRFLVLLAVYSVITLLALDNLGVNVTALVAGLGIGGLAVALATQSILGDVFGSLSITFDKPFEVGDFIIVGQQMGTVEEIGIKTTRVRALSGEQLIFTNTDLLSSRIQNYKRMRERRVVFKFGVEYGTPPETLEAISRAVREIISAQSGVRFDRAHFQGFGASSLDYEVVYWMLDPDYNKYMDMQQAINLELVRRLGEMRVNFAFPTQTLHVASLPRMG
ncbi:MAG: mechanosensitive ion channel family protein [Planctomycetota bacterium]|nr:mechanosensitive ion channel family protein [Planctomycetota bacterium]